MPNPQFMTLGKPELDTQSLEIGWESTYAKNKDMPPVPPLSWPGRFMTLVTSDKMKFTISQSVLGMASPLFGQILRQCATSEPPITTIPLQDVSSATLDSILHYVYPIIPLHKLKDVPEAIALLEVARRYQFEGVEARLLLDLDIVLDAETNPLRAWAGAIGCGAEVARKKAMIRYLRVEDDDLARITEEAHDTFQWTSGLQLYDLQKWRLAAIPEAKRRVDGIKLALQYCATHNKYFQDLFLSGLMSSINPFAYTDEALLTFARASIAARKRSVRCAQCTADPPDRDEQLNKVQEAVRTTLREFKAREPYISKDELVPKK